MSVAEIKSELARLNPAELAEVENALQVAKETTAKSGQPLSDFFGVARGTITFLPGWDEPEGPEVWHAMRDDRPL